MNPQVELQELLKLPEGQEPVLSVYLDTSVHEDGQRKHLLYFRRQVSRQTRMLEEAASPEALKAFQAKVEAVESYLTHRLDDQAKGLAIFSSPKRGLFKALELSVPVRNKFSYSDRPALDVLIELVEENPPFTVVVLDQHWGRIFNINLADVLSPVELSDDSVPGRTSVGGWSQMRYQRHRKDLIQHFMRDLGEQLERHMRRTPSRGLVLFGTQENLAEFQRHLSSDTRQKIIHTCGLARSEDESEIVERIREILEKARSSEEKQVADLLYDRLAQNYLAVAGPEETLYNLQMGRLERLLISPRFDGQGRMCSRCEFLFAQDLLSCSYCGGSTIPVDIRDRIEQVAEHHKVKIEVLQGPSYLDSIGGVGGLLKF